MGLGLELELELEFGTAFVRDDVRTATDIDKTDSRDKRPKERKMKREMDIRMKRRR